MSNELPQTNLVDHMGKPSFLHRLLPVRLWCWNARRRALEHNLCNFDYLSPLRKFDLPSLGSTEAGQPLSLFCGRVSRSRRCYVAWCLFDAILSGLGISNVRRLYGDLFAIIHKGPQSSGWGKGILGYDLLNGVSTFNPNQTLIQPSVEIGKIVRIETKLV